MFSDKAQIEVQAGAGGNGVVSFRREAHVPKGGPDGGDGGRGGAVEVVCDDSLRDLSAFRRRAHYRAKRGGHGQGSGKHGATPGALEIRVPPGTVIEDPAAGDRWDLVEAGQRAVVARGGSGGRGNRHFAAATRQTPRFAEKGLPGEERRLQPAPQAHGGRRARRSSQCRQVVSARPSHPGAPEGRRLSLHHDRAGAGHAGARRAPAGPGRHPGADRGRERGGRTGPRVPGPRRALPAADTRARRRAPRRLRSPRESRDGRGGAARARPGAVEPAPHHLSLEVGPRASRGGRGTRRASGMRGWVVRWSAPRPRRARASTACATSSSSVCLPTSSNSRPASSRRPTASTAPEPARPSRCGAPVRASSAWRDAAWNVFSRATTSRTSRRCATWRSGCARSGVIKALQAAGFEPGDDVEIAGTVFELDPGAPFR